MIYTVTVMDSLIRSGLNESTTTRLSAAEVLSAINTGNVEIAAKALCLEKDTLVVTTSGRNMIKHTGICINFIELIGVDTLVNFVDGVTAFADAGVTWYGATTSTTRSLGLQRIQPTTIGYEGMKGSTPQRWFNWGKYAVIEPVPDARYVLKLYYSDYPDELVNASDISGIPKEFHRGIVEFAMYALAIKLKRWADVALHYNNYISELQAARAIYVKKHPDPRSARTVPERVVEEDERT